MLREKTKQQILDWCKQYDLDCLNIRSIKQNGKSRIKVTLKCKKCGQRYDILKENLQSQRFPGMCTSCAHTEAQSYRKMDTKYIVDFFEKNGYQVLTPVEKIKPVGKNKSYNKSIVKVQNRHGDIFKLSYNNFYNRIDYYRDINNNDYAVELKNCESRLEYKVRKYLEELNIPYKQQFRYMDCRGDGFPLPFDFCLWYDEPEKRKLIEVDGEQHYREEFVDIQKRDKIKDYYCKQNHIELLRIPYNVFNKEESYKKIIKKYVST